jgi:anti-anti-sigma factor
MFATEPAGLQVKCDHDADAVVITIRGVAGVVEAARLDQALARLSARRPGLVVLDLAGLTFLSNIGMGALLAFQRAVARHGGRVRLDNVPAPIVNALRRVRLERVLDLGGQAMAVA